MTTSNRRIFIMQLIAGGSALAAASTAAQAGPALLDEKDPRARALGYKPDTSKVDNARYRKHDAAQKCGNCQLFEAHSKDPFGKCSIFSDKEVAANGWCSSWMKKA